MDIPGGKRKYIFSDNATLLSNSKDLCSQNSKVYDLWRLDTDEFAEILKWIYSSFMVVGFKNEFEYRSGSEFEMVSSTLDDL